MNLLNIHLLVQEFYAIEAMTALLSSQQNNRLEPMRHSHSRWHQDFHDFRSEYINCFASAIYDYTVLVVAAELRHCYDQSSQYIRDYYTSGMSRDAVYEECVIYDDLDILSAGIRMFDTFKVNWRSSYGGDKWKQIAKAGLMKGKIDDCVFIDHCVDLSHNNSVYFDKRAGLFYLHNLSEYRSFLDLKRYCTPHSLIKAQQGYDFNQLLRRADNLNIIDVGETEESDTDGRNEAESLLFEYRPIKWGGKRLDISENNIAVIAYFNDGDRDDDRDSDREYARAA